MTLGQKVAWYGRRLSVMGPQEIVHRLIQQWTLLRLRIQYRFHLADSRPLGGLTTSCHFCAAGARVLPALPWETRADTNVSLNHAAIRWDDGDWYLQEMKSLNHTRYNGKTLKEDSPPEPLGAENHFVIGNTVIEFRTAPRSTAYERLRGYRVLRWRAGVEHLPRRLGRQGARAKDRT